MPAPAEMPAQTARIGRVRLAPAPRLRRAAAVVAVAALVAAATGCGGDVQPKPAAEPTTVTKSLNWDLSRGGTIDQVRWPSQGTLFELSRGVQVNLTLPGGKAFKGRVEKVLGRREGRNLRNIELFFPAAGTDDAYARAKRLGKEWGIELGNLDEWHKRRKQQREKGKEDLSYAAFTGSGDSQPLGGSGPKPAIEVLNSFDKERPVVVNLSFLWPRPGQPR
jgi:hypothetical protein